MGADEDDIARRITERPRDLDPRTDACLAALAEHFAAAHTAPAPPWVNEPGRFLAQIWWPRYPGLWARAIVESPAAFRRRGILLGAGMLNRVQRCAETVLVLKCLAHRLGEDDDDVVLLAGQLGLHTAEDVLDLVEQIGHPRLLTPQVELFVGREEASWMI